MRTRQEVAIGDGDHQRRRLLIVRWCRRHRPPVHRRSSQQKLPRRLEANAFVHRHCPATRVNRHARGPQRYRMPRGRIHERRANALASMIRQHEDTLNVGGEPTESFRPRDARYERDPRHAKDLRSTGLSDERLMRVMMLCPPRR